MSQTHGPPGESYEVGIYEIYVKGHLDERWSVWFEGFTITLQDNGNTLLTGSVVDQAALHGLLAKVRDLGMTLLSINRTVPDQTNVAEIKPVSKES